MAVSIQAAFEAYQQGGVIAYPTEAVFGLGCDPENKSAVEKLLLIKQRPVEKGLILLAGDFEQLRPYLDLANMSEKQLQQLLSKWPNGVTQVLPASDKVPEFIRGQFDSIAVRVTDQPDVVALCAMTQKPVVSTSANLSGQPPGQTWQQVKAALGDKLDYIVQGQTLGFSQPSTIIDGLTGAVFRV